MWAFACGVVSSGASIVEHWLLLLAGVILAGPLLCATSQVVNDWYDREVDAINEPNRPIPSGRIPGDWGYKLAIAWSLMSLLLALVLGPWVFAATVIGLLLAWAYSAPPLRLKQNGWYGNAAVGFSYESLAWITGAAVMLGGAMPDWRILVLAVLYGLGAHGIMTLNDFKAVEGDRKMGVKSLPVQLGVDNAARLACWVMAVPQAVVVVLLLAWDRPYHAAAIVLLLAFQATLMPSLLEQPKERAPWYNATGTSLYVLGMLVAAFAVRDLAPLGA
jgi:chlorophyll synthase